MVAERSDIPTLLTTVNGENNSLWRENDGRRRGLQVPSVARGGATAYKRGGGVRRKSTSFGFGGQQARLFVSFFSPVIGQLMLFHFI